MTAREAFGGESAAGDDRARMRALGAGAHGAAREKFSLSAMAESFIALSASLDAKAR